MIWVKKFVEVKVKVKQGVHVHGEVRVHLMICVADPDMVEVRAWVGHVGTTGLERR